jgi:hypothetical protein
MFVLGNAGVVNGGDESEVLEGVQGLANLIFSEIEDWIAAGALVARIDEGVEGKRIVLGRGDLLFDEGAENAKLVRVEMHDYKGATSRWGR